MSRRNFLMWLSAATVAPMLPRSEAWAAEEPLVLVGATLIDVMGGPSQPDSAVVILGGRIAWVGHRLELPSSASEGAQVIDVSGKFIIPGLWDMHTHFGFDDIATVPLHIANGVTSVREMWGFPEIHAVRQRIESGEIFGPRFTIASSLIDGRGSIWAPDATQVGTAAEARAAVQVAKDANSDFLKIYSFLGEEAFEAIVDEAGKVGLRFAGHQPTRLPVRKVTKAGMRSYEHLYSMAMATSIYEQDFLRQLNQTPIDPANPRLFSRLMLRLDREASLSHSRAKAAALYDLMAREDVWQSPTLKVNLVLASPPQTFQDDPRLKYVDPFTREFWTSFVNRACPQTPEAIEEHRQYTRFRMDMVRRMGRAGVGILGGSDCGNPFTIPGFAAHDELEQLVEAGLSPARALRAMTADSARYLGLDADMGTVAAGKVADLIVLDANPLVDIRNSQRIHAVVTRGNLISAEQRQQILDGVEAAASAFAASASSRARTRGLACRCH